MAKKAKVPDPEKAIPGKLAVIADLHVANRQQFGGDTVDGINARCALMLETLERAIDVAAAERCELLFIAGDLFDSRRPEPAVIAGVQRVIAGARGSVEVVVIPGNHDMVDAGPEGGNTACAPLWESATVVTAKWGRYRSVVAVPFTARIPMAQHLMEVLGQVAEIDSAWPRVLVTHVGVYDDATAAPWMKRAKDAVNAEFLLDQMEKAGVTTAFVGNYHEHRVWQRRAKNGQVERSIYQVGTLCPGSFGDEGLENRGLMWTYDDKEIRRFEIPGPRFATMASVNIPSLRVIGCKPKSLFVRTIGWEVDPEIAEQLGGCEHVPVEDIPSSGPSNEDKKEEGCTASPLDALGAYVEQMPLPEGVDPGDVMGLVKDCWTKGTV